MTDSPTANTAFYDDGVEIPMGFGKTMRFYPLSWGAQRRLRTEWLLVFGGDRSKVGTPDWQDAVAKILFTSASRGNPQLKEEDFLEILDIRNLSACFTALTTASGMTPRAREGTEVRPTVSPNGADSTPPLSPPPDGPSTSVTS